MEATEFKVFIGQCKQPHALEAMQIFGGMGLVKEMKIERLTA
jgi:alkylation response protein AidB-like acyl-CoA dehydrogenase